MIAAIDNLASSAAAETATLRPAPDAPAFGPQLDHARARDAAEQLVASAFILPLLTQLRNDPFKSEMLHGGRGEEMFGQQLDTIIADRIVRKTNLPIVDSIYRAITHQPKTVTRGAGVNRYG